MFAHKLKFILLPQLMATLNNYACSLPPLVNVDWSAFPKCFVNPRLVKWRQRMAPSWLWRPDMAPTVGAHLSIGLVVEYWSFVDACTRHSYSKLYYLCLLSSLIKLLPPPTPPLHPSHPFPNIHWPNINEFHQKIVKNC